MVVDEGNLLVNSSGCRNVIYLLASSSYGVEIKENCKR